MDYLWFVVVVLLVVLWWLDRRHRPQQTMVAVKEATAAEAETSASASAASVIKKRTVQGVEAAFPLVGGPAIANADKTVVEKNPRVEILNYYAFNGENWILWEPSGAEFSPYDGCDRRYPLYIKGVWRNLENRLAGFQLFVSVQKFEDLGFVFIDAPEVFINEQSCGRFPQLLSDDENENKPLVNIPRGGKAKVVCRVQFRPGKVAPDDRREPIWLDYVEPIATEKVEAAPARPTAQARSISPAAEKAVEEEEKTEPRERQQIRRERIQRERQERSERPERREPRERLERRERERESEPEAPKPTTRPVVRPEERPRLSNEEWRATLTPDQESVRQQLANRLEAEGYFYPKAEPGKIGFRQMVIAIADGDINIDDAMAWWQEQDVLQKRGASGRDGLRTFVTQRRAQPTPTSEQPPAEETPTPAEETPPTGTAEPAAGTETPVDEETPGEPPVEETTEQKLRKASGGA